MPALRNSLGVTNHLGSIGLWLLTYSAVRKIDLYEQYLAAILGNQFGPLVL